VGKKLAPQSIKLSLRNIQKTRINNSLQREYGWQTGEWLIPYAIGNPRTAPRLKGRTAL
jgi:hypothetical protein